MTIAELKKGAHVHLIGICGTAMASLAGLLKDRGFVVTGSDSNPYPPMSTQIEAMGIKIQKPYSAQNLNPRPDFVIVGNVISASNEEAQAVQKLEIPYTSLPKAMGDFIIAGRESIVIAGTHGKTTTTSLMAWACQQQGFQPGFMIGGIAKNFSRSFQNPVGQYFIIEGDEYDTAYFDKVPKFIHYHPKHVVLTSIEFDHADIYKDLDAVKSAFRQLLRLIPNDGHLFYSVSDVNIQSILSETRCKNVFSYGIGQGDYQARTIKTKTQGSEFEVFKKNILLGKFQITLTGEYNILNCLSVIAMADSLGWDLAKVKEAFSLFAGVKRRQEVLGEPAGILIIEDFAHHPTAVRETIKGIKDKHPERKVFAVFEPRSATSRRKVFQKDYAEAFLKADSVHIMQAFDQTKIDEQNRFSSDELVADLKQHGKWAKAYKNTDQIVDDLKVLTKRGDLILIMSNGGFDGIYGKLLTALGHEQNLHN